MIGGNWRESGTRRNERKTFSRKLIYRNAKIVWLTANTLYHNRNGWDFRIYMREWNDEKMHLCIYTIQTRNHNVCFPQYAFMHGILRKSPIYRNSFGKWPEMQLKADNQMKYSSKLCNLRLKGLFVWTICLNPKNQYETYQCKHDAEMLKAYGNLYAKWIYTMVCMVEKWNIAYYSYGAMRFELGFELRSLCCFKTPSSLSTSFSVCTFLISSPSLSLSVYFWLPLAISSTIPLSHFDFLHFLELPLFILFSSIFHFFFLSFFIPLAFLFLSLSKANNKWVQRCMKCINYAGL